MFSTEQLTEIIKVLHQFKYNSQNLVKDRLSEMESIKKNILFFYYAKTPDNLLYEVKKSNKAFLKTNYRVYNGLED
jgi:hypothetical protein